MGFCDTYLIDQTDEMMFMESVQAVDDPKEANVVALVINPGPRIFDKPVVDKFYFCYKNNTANVFTAIMTWLGVYASNYIMFDTQIRLHQVRDGLTLSSLR